MTVPQPREHRVACSVCAAINPRRPVLTWALSGLCLAHEAT